MKRCVGFALLLCLLLFGCGGPSENADVPLLILRYGCYPDSRHTRMRYHIIICNGCITIVFQFNKEKLGVSLF